MIITTMKKQKLFITFMLVCLDLNFTVSDSKIGPDPWDYVSSVPTSDISNVPPDLRIPKNKILVSNSFSGINKGEWFFKRFLAIVLNGGHTKINDDGDVDISLQMKFNTNQWETLNEYIKSNVPLKEEMYRRSIGYIEEAIYKPTIIEEISIAWNEYIQLYLAEYKVYIVWALSICSVMGLGIWLWRNRNMSHKHVFIVIFVAMYFYEVVISYKEAEQKDLERFMTAVNRCSWFFWKSTCDVPSPDPLIFMKHMNPLKIAIRMFTTLISEPIIVLSESVNTMIHGITDGLWFPLDVILNKFLILFVNLLFIFLLVMIIFNYMLNIPFSLNLLGLVNIGVRQRRRMFHIDENDKEGCQSGNIDSISGVTLERFLDVCSRALDNAQSKNTQSDSIGAPSKAPKIKRSASTGRLPSSSSVYNQNKDINARKRQNAMFMIGGGDGK